MNWYKKAQLGKKLLKNIEKKKQDFLEEGWTPEEVEWALNMSKKLRDTKVLRWLLKQTRNKKFKINQLAETGETEDDDKIMIALDKFKKLKDKKMISNDQADINKIEDYDALNSIVSSFEKNKINVTKELVNNIEGAKVIYAEGNVSVVQIDTFEAGKELFDGGWCVKYNETHFYNTYGPPYLMFNLYNKPYALYSAKTEDFMDTGDDPMSVGKIAPLVESLRYLTTNGHIEESGKNLISEVLIQEELINGAAERGKWGTVSKILGSDRSYSNLIKKTNLNETIIKLVQSKFEEDYGRELPKSLDYARPRWDVPKINKFFNDIPYYLDHDRFKVTDVHLAMVYAYVKDYWKNYEFLNKKLKTKIVKEEATKGFQEAIEKNPDIWWEQGIPDLKTPEMKEFTINVVADYLSGKKRFPDDKSTSSITPSLRLTWLMSDLPDELKTPEIQKMIINKKVKENINVLISNPYQYDFLEDELKTPEMEAVRTQGYRHKMLPEDVRNGLAELTWREIPQHHKTPELIHYYNDLLLKHQIDTVNRLQDQAATSGTIVDQNHYDRLEELQSNFNQSNYYPGQKNHPAYQQGYNLPVQTYGNWYKKTHIIKTAAVKYLYHGTGVQNLSTILSEGLNADADKLYDNEMEHRSIYTNLWRCLFN